MPSIFYTIARDRYCLPDLNAMSFPVVLPYCTDLDDGTDDIFEDLGTNISLGSSSGKIITVIIFGLLSLNDKGWCSLQLMAYFISQVQVLEKGSNTVMIQSEQYTPCY